MKNKLLLLVAMLLTLGTTHVVADGITDLGGTHGKCYTIQSKNGNYFYADGTGIKPTGATYDSGDSGFRFTFISKDGNCYLYSVKQNQFVVIEEETYRSKFIGDGNSGQVRLTLSDTPDMTARVELVTGTNDATYPVTMYLGDMMICQPGWNGAWSIFNWYWPYPAGNDDNMLRVVEVAGASFDATEALAKMPSAITDLGQTSNYKCYTIGGHGRSQGGLFAKSGSQVSTTSNSKGDVRAVREVPRAAFDERQQWAVITYGGNRYLYSVSEKKFAKKESGQSVSFISSQAELSNAKSHLTSEAGITNCPIKLALNGEVFQLNAGWDAAINWNDDDSSLQIYEVEDFDPTEALLQLANLEGMCFTIQTERLATNWYVPSNETGTTVNVVALDGESNSTSDSRQLFALAKSAQDGSVYLYHVASGKFLTVDRTGWICLSDEPRSTAVLGDSDGNASYPYIIGLNGDRYVAHLFDVKGSNWFGSWERSYSELAMRTDPGCRVSLTPVRALTDAEKKNVDDYHAVDYKVTYTGDGSVVFKRRIAAKTGTAALPEEFFDNGLMTYSYNPSAIGNSTKEVNIDATWNGPFEISADYASAQWYWLRNDGRNLTYVPGDSYHVTRNEDYGFGDYGDGTTLPADASLAPDVQWAFIGSPYTGLTIVNRLAGNGWKLVKYVAEGNTNEADMRSSTATGEQDVWYPSKSNVGTGGFQLGLNANGTGDVLNSYSVSPLRFWRYDTEDGNNAWYCAPVPVNWAAYVVRDLASFFQEAKDKPFTLPASEQTDLTPLYTSRSASATYEDYIDLVTTVAKKVIYPESGRYQIKSAVRNRYMGYGYNGNDAGLVTLDDKYASTVLTLTRSGAAFPYTYTLAVEDDKKAVIPDGFGGRPVPIDIEGHSTPTSFTFLPSACGEFVIRYGNGRSDYLYEWYTSSAYAVANWLPTDGGSKWCIEDATQVAFTLNAAKDLSGHNRAYATAYLPFDVTLPDGVTAYALTSPHPRNAGDETLIINPTDIGREVPAGTPVLIASNTAGTIAAAIGTVTATAPETNILQGIYFPETSTGTSHLVLNKNAAGNIGFYNLKSGSTLQANRAYIPYSQGTPNTNSTSSARGISIFWNFDIDDEATIGDVTKLVKLLLRQNDGGDANLAPSTEGLKFTDVNGDGKITIADVTALVNKILGK